MAKKFTTNIEHGQKNSLGVQSPSCYFLDFFFPDKMIDLEIDGKQHKYKDRKQSDKVGDNLLRKSGYNIFRIEWKSINNDTGKQYIRERISEFLEFFHSTGSSAASSAQRLGR